MIVALLLVLPCIPSAAPIGVKPEKANRWEKAILAFEEKERQQMPPPGGILFVGSSTIRIWNVQECFPELDILNRGFGGSDYADVAQSASRIILPYRPKTIVLYAGDNDIAGGKSADQVFKDFSDLVAQIRSALPDALIIVLSIKASPARWNNYPEMKKANTRVSEWAQKQPRIKFVDMGTPLLDSEGHPRRELFMEDGLHLNLEGYKIWTAIVKPLLVEATGR